MIPIRNIYYMLSYAFQVLSEQGYKNIETEQFETWTWTGVHREIGITVVITWADRNLGIGQNEESTKKAARMFVR